MADQGSPRRFARIDRLGRAVAWLAAWMQRLRWPAVALTLAALVLVLVQRDHLWASGLSGLNPAPLDMQKLDAELRRDAGTPDLQHMVVVTAETEEAALRAAEQAEQGHRRKKTRYSLHRRSPLNRPPPRRGPKTGDGHS